MAQKQKTISRFLKEFVAFLFVLGIVLAMLAPITSAQDVTSGTGGGSSGGTAAQGTGGSGAGSAPSAVAPAKTSPTTTSTPVTEPGAYKDDYIYIPLNPAAYPDFPKLSSTTPTGMLSEFANGLIRNAKFILGAVAVLFIMLSALKLIISQGNDDTITKQKNAITYGIIGLLIIGFGDEFAKVLSVACAPGETECARGGFLKDPNNIIRQAALFKQETRVIITFIKYLIGGVAIFMFIRNGIRLIGLAGSEESIALDKKNLIYTSVGLVAIILATTLIDKVLYIVDPSKYSSMGLDPAINPTRAVQEMIGFTNMAVTFVAPLAILMLIVGAIMYATAGGKEEQTNKAKKIIFLSIAGMVLIYGSFAIVSTIVAGQFSP
ncbi:hypothetical protein ACFL3T_02205 [Patescibacteria group bacterium]